MFAAVGACVRRRVPPDVASALEPDGAITVRDGMSEAGACTYVIDDALDIPPPVEYKPPADCSPSSSCLG